MKDKLPLLVGYAALLLTVTLSVWWAPRVAAGAAGAHASPFGAWRKWVALAFALVFGIALVRLGLSGAWLLVLLAAWAAFCEPPTQRLSLAGLAAATAAAASGSLLWWTSPAAFDWISAALAAVLIIVVSRVMKADRATPHPSVGRYSVVTGLVTLGAALFLFLQPAEVAAQWFVAWHHWGAYLGSAESVAAGLRPFHDIPLQYGIGPTLLLLPAADGSGFPAMYWVVFILTVASVFAVVAVCVDAFASRSRLAQAGAAAAALAACLFWTAQPWALGTAMMTPSTLAMRFAPAYGLIYVLTRPARQPWLTGTAWVLCLLWSVESAFYAVAIFGAHKLFELAPARAPVQVLRVVVAVAWRVALTFAVAAGVFRLVFGVYPSPSLYAFYAFNPPGVLPVNWAGPIWWFLLVIGLGVFALVRQFAEDAARHRLYLCLVSCIAFSSYYLGRSHDNNVLNLMSSLVMVLCCAAAAIREGMLAPAARVAFATPLFLLPFFGYDGWPAPIGHDAAAYKEQFAYSTARYPEVARALRYIEDERGEGADVVTMGAVNVAAHGPARVWNALHPLTNFMFSPSAKRQELLRAGAARLGKPGWLIVDRRMLGSDVVRDFEAIYARAEEREFGAFVAIRFVPAESAGKKVGP